MSFTIRVLTEDDAGAFYRLRLRAVREEITAFITTAGEFRRQPPQQLAQSLAPTSDHVILGAFEGEQLVGMVGLARKSRVKLRHKADIWGMYVAPGARSQGVGRALMQAAIARARSMHGVEQILLSVVETQTTAQHLYIALGFVVYGREPRAVKVGDRYLAEDLMLLDLTGGAK
jgi:ribosomal protein S18 acetylase RimI-like enzyme